MLNDIDSDAPPSLQKGKFLGELVRPRWKELVAFFESKKAPGECKGIADAYAQCVRETGNYVSDAMEKIQSVMDAMSGDMTSGGEEDVYRSQAEATKELYKMLDTNDTMIDEAGIRADKGVRSICDRYGVRKWFEIKGDIGGGGLSAMPSIPMPGMGQ